MITLEQVRAIFADETVEYVHGDYKLANGTVATDPDLTIVRSLDGRIHGHRAVGGPERQYSYLIDLATGLTGKGPDDLQLRRAGFTRHGGRGYIQLSSGSLTNSAGLAFAPQLSLAMSMDGSLAVSSSTSNVVIICDNTLSANFGEVGKNGVIGAKVKQTKHHSDELILSRHSVALDLERTADEFDLAIQKLTEETVTDAAWEKIVDEIAPLSKDLSKHANTRNEATRDKLFDLWQGDDRVAPWKNTKLGAVQAINTYDIWLRGTRGEVTPEDRMIDELLDGTRSKREIDANKLVTKVLATV